MVVREIYVTQKRNRYTGKLKKKHLGVREIWLTATSVFIQAPGWNKALSVQKTKVF